MRACVCLHAHAYMPLYECVYYRAAPKLLFYVLREENCMELLNWSFQSNVPLYFKENWPRVVRYWGGWSLVNCLVLYLCNCELTWKYSLKGLGMEFGIYICLKIKMHIWYILIWKIVIILSFWKRGAEGSRKCGSSNKSFLN